MTDEEWDRLMARVAYELHIMENSGEWWHEVDVFTQLVEEAQRLRAEAAQKTYSLPAELDLTP